MYGRFKEEQICIEKDTLIAKYPEIEDEKYANDVLILGDLHGNALKLIRHLIKHNRLEIPKENYQLLVDIHSIVASFISYKLYRHYQKSLERRKIRYSNKGRPPEDLVSLTNYVDILQTRFVTAQEIYKKITNQELEACSNDYIKGQLQKFQDILNDAKVVSTAPILLLGDDVAERDCAGDELIIWTYKVLALKGIEYKICNSNHGLKFIQYLESKKSLSEFAYPRKNYNNGLGYVKQHQSFQHLALLIYLGIIDGDQMLADIKQVWSENLNLINYYIEGNTIISLTHSFAGLRTLNNAFCQIGTECNFKIETFPKAIDFTNAKFAELKLEDNISSSAVYEGVDVKNIDFTNYIVRLVWNRSGYGVDDDICPYEFNGHNWLFVHGHHNYGKHESKFIHDNCISLNDKLGKDWPESKPRKSIAMRLSACGHASFFTKTILGEQHDRSFSLLNKGL